MLSKSISGDQLMRFKCVPEAPNVAYVFTTTPGGWRAVADSSALEATALRTFMHTNTNWEVHVLDPLRLENLVGGTITARLGGVGSGWERDPRRVATAALLLLHARGGLWFDSRTLSLRKLDSWFKGLVMPAGMFTFKAVGGRTATPFPFIGGAKGSTLLGMWADVAVEAARLLPIPPNNLDTEQDESSGWEWLALQLEKLVAANPLAAALWAKVPDPVPRGYRGKAAVADEPTPCGPLNAVRFGLVHCIKSCTVSPEAAYNDTTTAALLNPLAITGDPTHSFCTIASTPHFWRTSNTTVFDLRNGTRSGNLALVTESPLLPYGTAQSGRPTYLHFPKTGGTAIERQSRSHRM
jgi:hypothetical protein